VLEFFVGMLRAHNRSLDPLALGDDLDEPRRKRESVIVLDRL
jgi:hypothetical protein